MPGVLIHQDVANYIPTNTNPRHLCHVLAYLVTALLTGRSVLLSASNGVAGGDGEAELTGHATRPLQEEHLGELLQDLPAQFGRIGAAGGLHEGVERGARHLLDGLCLLIRSLAPDVRANTLDQDGLDVTGDVDVLDHHLDDVVTHFVQVMHERRHDSPNCGNRSDRIRRRSDCARSQPRHRVLEQRRVSREPVDRRPKHTCEVGIELLDRVLQLVRDVGRAEDAEGVAELQHHTDLHPHFDTTRPSRNRILQFAVDVGHDAQFSEHLAVRVTMRAMRSMTVAMSSLQQGLSELLHRGEERNPVVPEGGTDPTPLREEWADVDALSGMLQHPGPNGFVAASQDVVGNGFLRHGHPSEVGDEHHDGATHLDGLALSGLHIEEDQILAADPRGDHQSPDVRSGDPESSGNDPHAHGTRLRGSLECLSSPRGAEQAPVQEPRTPGTEHRPEQTGRRTVFAGAEDEDRGYRQPNKQRGDRQGRDLPPLVEDGPGEEEVEQHAQPDSHRIAPGLGLGMSIIFIIVMVRPVTVAVAMRVRIAHDDRPTFVGFGE